MSFLYIKNELLIAVSMFYDRQISPKSHFAVRLICFLFRPTGCNVANGKQPRPAKYKGRG